MFDIVNLATFAWSVYNVWIGYTGFRYSVWITFFNDKILFNMTLDESVILLLVATCNIMFDGERFKYFFRKSFMSSIVAPQKILTLTKFGFAPDSLFYWFREAWNPRQITLFRLPNGLKYWARFGYYYAEICYLT